MKYIDRINPHMNTVAIRKFCEVHNNIHHNLKNVIHVAGTNGKGSTVAFIRAILEAHGYTVNVFTSPHLIRQEERIRIRGKLITPEYDQYLERYVAGHQLGKELSVFETFVAKAFLAFNKYPADFTLLEVGLGGRLDATNVVDNPLVSVITPIDYDHQHILGNSLREIAKEKLSIIKPNGLVVSAWQHPSLHELFYQTAHKLKAKLIMGGRDWFLKTVPTILFRGLQNGSRQKLFHKILCYTKCKRYKMPAKLGLLGEHQYDNAGLAVVVVAAAFKKLKANSLTQDGKGGINNKGLVNDCKWKNAINWLIDHFRQRQNFGKLLKNYKLNLKAVHKGLQEATWAARLQPLPTELYGLHMVTALSGYCGMQVIADGAHNNHGAKALVQWLQTYHANWQVYIVMGLMATKNAQSYLQEFTNNSHNLEKKKNIATKECIDNVRADKEGIRADKHFRYEFYFVNLPKDFEGYDSAKLTSEAVKLGLKAYNAGEVKEALVQIYQQIKKSSSTTKNQNYLILICGSLYLIGNILQENNIAVD